MTDEAGRSTVSIAPCSDYARETIRIALESCLAPLGGMSAFVSPGEQVLLKVNLLSRAVPERAVTTHPEVVRALVHSVRACGAEPFIGDSPGGPNTTAQVRRVWAETGIGPMAQEEGVDLVLFDDECVRVPAPGGHLYTSFTVGAAVARADKIICVPKFKTHGLMMFTGAVKNLFGCIPGLEKARFHLTVPDRHDFGEMLIDLMLACRPTLSIMDAVIGMEGDGPAGGSPRHIGALMASGDAVALDVVASAMAGLSPMEVYTNRAAAARGLGPASIDDVTVTGEDWRTFAPADFKVPSRDLAALLPVWIGRRLRMLTTARPVLESSAKCTRCGFCEKSCPVDAITIGESGPRFDHGLCIRCYCCQELCPPQAIGLTEPLVARMIRRRT